MHLSLQTATVRDAAALAALHTTIAEDLTERHGPGAWSAKTSEKGVVFTMRTSRIFVAREGAEIIATFRLSTKKPWAVDASFFTACRRPLYLLSMAVTPERQRMGIGRRCIAEAVKLAAAWPADAIRLDAYDGEAGAGEFYARCGWVEKGRVTYRNAALIYYEMPVAPAGRQAAQGCT
jgi:GNAT superfamily N-acetyltransferase